MSDKQTYCLAHAQARQNAAQAVMQAPDGWFVTLAPKTRTLDQNAKLWAMLGEIAKQVIWHGQQLTAENWKDMATASLKRQQVVPGIDGGFVVLGARTSKMTTSELAELIEFLHAFSANHGVVFADERRASLADLALSDPKTYGEYA